MISVYIYLFSFSCCLKVDAESYAVFVSIIHIISFDSALASHCRSTPSTDKGKPLIWMM